MDLLLGCTYHRQLALGALGCETLGDGRAARATKGLRTLLEHMRAQPRALA